MVEKGQCVKRRSVRGSHLMTNASFLFVKTGITEGTPIVMRIGASRSAGNSLRMPRVYLRNVRR